MLDFICILSIILEIFAVSFCCIKIIELENKVYKLNDKLNKIGEKILITCQNIRKNIQKLNKIINILTNKKFWQIKKIIFMILDTIQIIIFINSLDFSKGLKSINYRTLKRLFFAQVSKEIIRKILTQSANCA